MKHAACWVHDDSHHQQPVYHAASAWLLLLLLLQGDQSSFTDKQQVRAGPDEPSYASR